MCPRVVCKPVSLVVVSAEERGGQSYQFATGNVRYLDARTNRPAIVASSGEREAEGEKRGVGEKKAWREGVWRGARRIALW